MKTKKCYHCQETKPTTEYYKNKTRSDGIQSHCKVCHRDRKKQHYNQNKDKYLINDKAWTGLNRGKRRKISNRYRAKKLKATPPWLTDQHHVMMGIFYSHARDCEMVSGEKYHVDHIVPLQGKNVCGLHVPWNLQVLPSDINCSKSNTYNATCIPE